MRVRLIHDDPSIGTPIIDIIDVLRRLISSGA